MAEDESRENPRTDPDAPAAAIALSGQGTLDPRAAAYLEKQGRLTDLQSHHLREQIAFEMSHLRWRRFGDRMSGALQAMVALIALMVVIGLGVAIWYAANDRGLVVEAFSVPPDLAAKGLTGEVIASKILDRLSTFQAQTVSGRVATSYQNNWGDDIKVQIPEAGVSIGEFNRALHQWLGHATHISGEIYRTPKGIAVAARVGGNSTPAFKGGEDNLDTLLDQAAERIYRSTQPYRYAPWLEDHGRTPEAIAILQSIIAGDDPEERAWAYNGMAHMTIVTGDVAKADGFAQKAIENDPHILLPQTNLAGGETYLGHDEAALGTAKMALKTALAGDPTMGAIYIAQRILAMRMQVAMLTGDDLAARDFAHRREALNDLETGREDEMMACAALHDLACFRTIAAALSPAPDDDDRLAATGALQQADALLGRWDAVMRRAPAFHGGLAKAPFAKGFEAIFDAPLHALAEAQLGDIAGARALIAAAPLDCILCLRIRGRIDALAHNWRGAAYWFARAADLAPSVPLPIPTGARCCSPRAILPAQ